MNQFLQLFRCLWVLYFQIRGTDSVKTHLPFSANGKVGSCACIAIFIVSQICADEKPFLRPKRKKCGFFHPPNRILLPIAPARGFVENLRASVEPGAQLLIIASDPDAFAGNDEMAATFEGCFAAAEIELEDVCVLDSRNADDAAELVAQSGVILLSGGHVPTENAFFASMDLRDLLADFDGVIIGISAGSMNCADTVYAQPEEPGEAVDPDYQRFIPGLGLTTRNILPHYNQVKDNVLDGLRLFEDITAADSAGHTFYILPDGSYILARDGDEMLCGEAWLMHNGVLEKLTEDGEELAL